MVNPKVGEAGEGSKKSKGKRKLVFPSDTCKDIPPLSPSDEELDEKLGNALNEERSEWDDPMALQLEQLIICNLKDAFQSAIKKIVEHGYSEEQAKWAVFSSSGLYIGSKDITSNIVGAALALLTNRKDFDTSERLLFDSVERLAEFVLVEMVNVLRQVKPYLTVAEAMWQLLMCDLNLLNAGALERETQYQFSSGVKCSSSTEKDEMIASLMQRKQQLQKELQGWTDWTNVKVRQAAQRLSKDQAELRMLRKEREEADKLPKDKNIMKRLCEMEAAKLDGQMKEAKSALRRLQAENTMLMKEMADSKLNYEHSSKKLQEVKLREQELLKQGRTLEGEISILQEEHAALKGKGANLQVQLEKARRRQNEIEALWRHEEREKTKFLGKAESLQSETKQLMHLAKVEEDNMRAKAEANKLKFEERINKLTTEISALKLAALGGVKRERECVMCLTEEKSVVFIPCAHQVLCKDCNVLHEKQENNDCPFCRTPIVKRIIARFVPPKAC